MMTPLWVGIDWGHEHCQVFAQPHQHKPFSTRVRNEPAQLAELCNELHRRANGAEVRVIIETNTGPVVHALLQHQCRVFATNPRHVDNARALLSMDKAKDDCRDALVLAALADHPHALNEIAPSHPLCVRIKRAARRAADVSHRRVAAAAQLQTVLRDAFPAMLLLGTLDTEWLLRLCILVPSARHARLVDIEQVRALLTEQRVRKYTAEQVLSVLQQPAVAMAPGEAEAYADDVELLAEQTRLFLVQLRRLRKQLQQLLAEYSALQRQELDGVSDVEIVLSNVGVGTQVASVLLGEGLLELVVRDLQMARAWCGTAPVTVVTGKRQTQRRPKVSMRRACSGPLREAMHMWAEKSVQNEAAARQRYEALRARGHSHGRALRQMADGYLKRLRAMLRDRTLYEPREEPKGVVTAA